MKFISYSGATIALVLAQPNWNSKPVLSMSLPTDATRGISGRESRRNFARSSRYSFNYTTRFNDAADATEFRIGLQRLKDELMAVPLWVDPVRLSAQRNAVARRFRSRPISPFATAASGSS
jgi:hypothetical protein